MQRLFSTFPAGAPGFALLLLRLALAALLAARCWDRLQPGWGPACCAPSLLWEALLPGLLAAALALGWWMPVACGLLVAMQSVDLWATGRGGVLLSWLPLVNGLALAAIGPGAFSMDARRYGRVILSPAASGRKTRPGQGRTDG